MRSPPCREDGGPASAPGAEGVLAEQMQVGLVSGTSDQMQVAVRDPVA